MNIFDGNKLAQKILESLKQETSAWPRKPSVAVVNFGDKSSNSSYIAQKRKTADFLGFAFNHYHYSELDFPKARDYLNKISRSEKHTAVVVQMPLPREVNPAVLNVIPVEKDPDLLSDRAVGMFFNGRPWVNPPTAGAILKILAEAAVSLANKQVILFGHGRLVGRFLLPLLLQSGAAVTVIDRFTDREKVLALSQEADIIISAVGQANLITGDMVKDGVAVVDAGFSLIDGKIKGDVEFESVAPKASLITPMPGGVGPVSVALLFENNKVLFEKFHK